MNRLHRTTVITLVLVSLGAALCACAHTDQATTEVGHSCRHLPSLNDDNVEETHRCYQETVASNPENALAWLNLARTTAWIHAAQEPEDECEFDGNWHYEVLYLLSRALELDSTVVHGVLDEGLEPPFFSPDNMIYVKWRIAATVNWDTKNLIALMRDREWWPYQNDFPPVWIETGSAGRVVQHTFDNENFIGTWKVVGDKIWIALDEGGPFELTPVRSKHYFNTGESWFFALGLQLAIPETKAPWEMPLVVGPRVGDCGEYNF